MLGPREKMILETIIKSNITSSKQLSEELDFSMRQISYSIKKINVALEELNREKIIRTKGGEWRYSGKDLQVLLGDYMNTTPDVVATPQFDEYKVPEIRIHSEILLLLVANEKIQIEELMSFSDVSRNTILLDLKKIRELLKKKSLTLQFITGAGYSICGNETDISYFIVSLVNELLTNHTMKSLENLFIDMNPTILSMISQYESLFQLHFSDNSFQKLFYIMGLFGLRFKSAPSMKIMIPKQLYDAPEYQFLNTLFKQMHFPFRNEMDIAWITLQFLSQNTIFNQSDLYDTKIFSVILKMIQMFEVKSTISIHHVDSLAQRLFFHLKPAIYRVKYDIPFDNTDLANISSDEIEINMIYEILKDCVQPIEHYIGKKMPPNELRLLAFYFGSELLNENMPQLKEKTKAIVVCTNGLIVANLMKQNLEDLFPELDFLTTSSVRDLLASSNNFDIIFSNVPIEVDHPIFVVKSFMNEEEKKRLRRKVLEETMISERVAHVNSLIKIINKYSHIRDKAALQNELSRFLAHDLTKSIKLNLPKKESGRYALTDYLSVDNIQILQNQHSHDSWKEILKYSCAPLLQAGKITENYVKTLIMQLDSEDSYYFLNDTIAIPHSSPENGVIEEGCALLISHNQIIFPGNHAIHFIVPFALFKSDRHILAINQLMTLSKSTNLQTKILHEKSTEKIYTLLSNL